LFYPFFVFIYFNPGKFLFGLFANLVLKSISQAQLGQVKLWIAEKRLKATATELGLNYL
jgi:hypothetical protein